MGHKDKKFEKWFKGLDWHKEFVKKHGYTPDINDSIYDYYSAYKSGVKPEWDEEHEGYYWPDVNFEGDTSFKSPKHPRFGYGTYEDITGKKGDAGLQHLYPYLQNVMNLSRQVEMVTRKRSR